MNDVGIKAFGGYIPRLRLSRESIVKANGWVTPGLMAYSKSERSICHVDEDSITMAVQAGRNCLVGMDRQEVDGLCFASTTAPFDDRQNASVIAGALGLREDITTLDVSHSQRAGTSGLISALKGVAIGSGTMLYLASDHRQTMSASVQELLFGDGAAALTLGTENVIARFLGFYSITRDFVDHYRGQGSKFDNEWEERWVRDEGYYKIVPDTIGGLFKKTGVSASDINHFVMPCIIRGVREGISKKMGIPAEAIRDNLQNGCGETGTAHSLLMLVDTLQNAKPGQKILVIGFGQGADALLFEATDKLRNLPDRKGIKAALSSGTIEKNYQKYLSFNNRVDIQWGIRAERGSLGTKLSVAYRYRKMVMNMVGGRCTECGTVQFPAAHICVNPECRAIDTQEDYCLAESSAKIASYTVDWLAYTPNPPLVFGMVEFESRAKCMMEVVDCDPDKMEVGMPVEMVFRIKDFDRQRNLRTYCWKATPRRNKE